MDERQIIQTYHNLVEIEDQFRVMKSTLETRPIYVRTDEHIIAHLTMCTISLILLRIIQKQIKNIKNIDISAVRIQSALNRFTIEKLADEYHIFNNIDDEDLKLILESFNVNTSKKLYRPIELRSIKKTIKF